jgi:thiosulfate dehydrogenase (quinone) large subunit
MIPGVSILPLRLFLGFTFIYAAYQKVTDPGFFNKTVACGTPSHPHAQCQSSTYIGAQIAAYSHGTPLGSILSIAAEHAVAVGALTVLTEFVIGCLTLTGLFTRGAAIVGLLLNFSFFLTASWLTYPYFLGSDIVFVAAWMTIIFTGSGAYALDFRVGHALAVYQRRSGLELRSLSRAAVIVVFGPPASNEILASVATDPGTSVQGNQTETSDSQARGLSRREVGFGILAAAGLFLVGLTPRKWSSSVTGVANPEAPFSPSYRFQHRTSTPAPTPRPTKGASDGDKPTPTPKPTPTSDIPDGAQRITNTSQMPVNSGFDFTNNNDGLEAVIVHNTDGNFVCFTAICTHAGCTVGYNSDLKLIKCPCHQSEFDANNHAEVVSGPAPTPLQEFPLKILPNGDIYLIV